MGKESFDIVSIGDCSVDYFVVPEKFEVTKAKGISKLSFGLAEKIPVKTLDLFPGGNALNTATAFRRLGLNTAIVTELGKDPGAEIILKRISAEKIDSRFVSQKPGEQTNRSIIIVTSGERTILSYHCDKEYSNPKNLSAKWIYLTSLGSGFNTAYKLVYKNKSVKIAYNPGSQQLMHNIPAVRKMITRSNLLFVNLDEANKILSIKSRDIKANLRGLLAKGAKNVFITDGPNGAFASFENRYLKMPIFPAKRVDATGAGDAFASAATAAIALGNSVEEALRWGTVMAAHEVSEVGVQNGLLNRTMLIRILARNKNFKPQKL